MIVKLYYNDPLKAAWMADNFKVRFGIKYYNILNFDWLAHSGYDICQDYVGFGNRKLYVHPDDYHIFEITIDDVVKSGSSPNVAMAIAGGDHHEYRYADYLPIEKIKNWGDAEIIQRDGKAFFTPLREE